MSAFKVGDRVRYVGRCKPFYVSPRQNAQGTVTAVADDMWHATNVVWDDRLRYCKETDSREWRMKPTELELIP